MADEPSVTSSTEPGAQPLTSGTEPQPGSTADSSTTPQPTVEQLQAEVRRYQAAASGSADEWRKEKERREQLEMRLTQLERAQQAPQVQPQREVSDEELAGQLTKATWDQNNSEVARILRLQRERGSREVINQVGQFAAQAQQQQSFNSYLASRGIKPGTPLYQKVTAEAQAIDSDPEYFFARGNVLLQVSLAADRVTKQVDGDRRTAMDTIRQDTAGGAGSEGGRGSGAPPGKVAAKTDTIYLTEAEKRVAHKMYDNLSHAEAEKRHWQAMHPHLRDRRIEAGKAIV